VDCLPVAGKHLKYVINTKENNTGMTIKGKIEICNGQTSARETVFLLET
jgi:hypothetical protein